MAWKRRLSKRHTHKRQLTNVDARELDSCTSSDALLMNVFCYPGLIRGEIARVLRVKEGSVPAFGTRAGVPLRVADRAVPDATELDMVVGDTIVEAKLTEASFVAKSPKAFERYREFDGVFDSPKLVRDRTGAVRGYQLIRNVLAMKHRGARRFVTIIDARRPDLIGEWMGVKRAIADAGLRRRCVLITWQWLSQHVPVDLQRFLTDKYSIRYS